MRDSNPRYPEEGIPDFESSAFGHSANLPLSDAWAPIKGNLENQDSKTALSAQLKLEGIGLFGRMIALRQGMGA